jgi:hypothetical protein
MKLTLSQMAYIAALFRNDLHFLHHHVSGVDFDEIHEIAGEYYDKALEDADYFAERAISAGEELVNFSSIHKTDIYSSWNVLHGHESIIGFDEFCKYFDEQGRDYLEALDSLRPNVPDFLQSDIDEIHSYWATEVEYKNVQRMK